jgi:hypothetical protein
MIKLRILHKLMVFVNPINYQHQLVQHFFSTYIFANENIIIFSLKYQYLSTINLHEILINLRKILLDDR